MSERYGLSRPVAADTRAAVLRVHGGDGPRVWDRLVLAAGSGKDLERLLAVMEVADPSTRMCGLAQRIRLVTCTSLAAHNAGYVPVADGRSVATVGVPPFVAGVLIPGRG
jgi:hypothetical protein